MDQQWRKCVVMRWAYTVNESLVVRLPTQGDSIRPLDVRCHQNLSVHSVHTRLLNFGWLAPVRPVQKTTGQTTTQIQNRSVNVSVIGDKGFHPKLKTQAFHPPRQRIHSDGCWFFEASVEQNLLFGSVEVGYRNGFGAEVRPVQVLINPVHSDSHRSLDVVYHFVVCANVPSFVQHSAARNKTETVTKIVRFKSSFKSQVKYFVESSQV